MKNGVLKEFAFQNLKTIIEAIQAKGALVVVGGVNIPIWGRGFGDGYPNRLLFPGYLRENQGGYDEDPTLQN